jgi:small-conductance mechanosensitive channel
VIGIGYEDNIQLARDTALALMKADPRVLQTPAPDVVVYELGAHAINLGIRCYVKSADWFGTKVTLLEQLKLGLTRPASTSRTRSRTCTCTCMARMAAWSRPTRWCATSPDPCR